MKEIKRYRENLQDEIDGAALYASLAKREKNPNRKDLFQQLSESEAEHADLWREKLRHEGVIDLVEQPSLKTRLLIWLADRFGPAFVLPAIVISESVDRDKYASQPDALALSAEERGHAAVIQAAVNQDGSVGGSEIVRAEHWHRGASGNELRAAVLGVNDGLVSNFCLVMGVAGAGAAPATVLLTGAAGLVAGAFSMALGEWLSVANARELARSQLDKEAEELALTPEAEQKELALIYQAKGLAREDAQRIAAQVMQNRDTALDTLAREELGIDPEELGGSPWKAAGASLLLFAVGAVVPVLPFIWLNGMAAVAWSCGLSLLALGGIGMVTALFNGRGFAFSAARQILFGGVAAAITYGAGILFGASIA